MRKKYCILLIKQYLILEPLFFLGWEIHLEGTAFHSSLIFLQDKLHRLRRRLVD